MLSISRGAGMSGRKSGVDGSFIVCKNNVE